MNHRTVWAIFVLLGLLAGGCATQPRQTFVRVTANTEPSGAWIYKQGEYPAQTSVYRHLVTDAEKLARKVQLPPLVFEKPGFLPHTWTCSAVSMDSDLWKGQKNWNNGEKVILKKDSSYEGPVNKNHIKLTVNSEPQGARVYSTGRFLGTTPLVLDYTISNRHYQAGSLQCASLIAVHDSCLPEKQELKLQIDSEWRYEAGQTHEYATLFLLRRDPNYRPPTIVQQQGGTSGESTVNMNVKQQKDALDTLQQAGSIISIFQSLKPLR